MPADTLRDQLQATLGTAYTLERELGGGGMSRVFLAQETRLGRAVVVKVLSPDLAAGVSAQRFEQEIRLAAALQQANIVPVITAGETDGLPYYTMPFVEGLSLRARLARGGAMPVTDVVSVLRDIGRALAFAHERGVVHRDIKPENVLLSGDAAVVTDFGIAKALAAARTHTPGETLTQLGTSIGTPAYMAPEQAAGDPATDHRADLYALGGVAYEMLAGAAPFAGRPAHQLLAAHMTETPMPVEKRRADTPQPLSQLVARCLEKDPARRPQSAREFLQALDTMNTGSGARVARAGARRWVAGAVLVATGAAAFFSVRPWRGTHRVAPDPSLAVLPLENGSGDTASAYFAAGLSEELTSAVAKVPGLRVIGGASAAIAKGTGPVEPRTIGRKLHVAQVLEGSVRRAGPKVRLVARLESTGDGSLTWSESYERDATDVFAVQSEIAQAVARALEVRLARADSARLVLGGTRDTVAHELFLRARELREQYGEQNIRQAIRLYEQATQRDPRFAEAWGRIADAWLNLADEYIPPREAAVHIVDAADRALAIDPNLPMARIYRALMLAVSHRLSIRAAAEEGRRAAADAPNDALVQTRAAYMVLAVDPAAGAELGLRAIAANPLSGVAQGSYGFVRAYSNPADAESYGRRSVALLPDVGIAHGLLATTLLREGKNPEALAEFERGAALGDRDLSIAGAGVALARLGRRDEARRRLATLETDATKRYVIGDWVTKLCLALGDRNRALYWLERAANAGSGYTKFIDVDRDFDSLRGDPRFEAVRKRVGLVGE